MKLVIHGATKMVLLVMVEKVLSTTVNLDCEGREYFFKRETKRNLRKGSFLPQTIFGGSEATGNLSCEAKVIFLRRGAKRSLCKKSVLPQNYLQKVRIFYF
uniref:Secreted protein n=1 Tax=Megaselia scalaris TaxID=36166 RepID=T1GFX7_MEGSC